MAKEFLLQFSGQAFTVGQQLAFSFLDKKLLGLVVKSLEGKYGCGCICIISVIVRKVLSFKNIKCMPSLPVCKICSPLAYCDMRVQSQNCGTSRDGCC
jgi:hypothetical protein